MWGGRTGLATGRSDPLRGRIRQVRASHKVSAVFDDPNLIGSAGLVPILRLAERGGLHGLLQAQLSVPSPNTALKSSGVIAGMIAGAGVAIRRQVFISRERATGRRLCHWAQVCRHLRAPSCVVLHHAVPRRVYDRDLPTLTADVPELIEALNRRGKAVARSLW